MMENKEKLYVTWNQIFENSTRHAFFHRRFKLKLQDRSNSSNGLNKTGMVDRISDIWIKTCRKRKTVGVVSFVSCTQALIM